MILHVKMNRIKETTFSRLKPRTRKNRVEKLVFFLRDHIKEIVLRRKQCESPEAQRKE